MKKIKFSFLFGLLTLQGCFFINSPEVNSTCDSDCITIKGTLTTGHEDSELADGLYMELGWGTTNFLYAFQCRTIATCTTDDGGEFSFTFKPQKWELNEGGFRIIIPETEEYFESEYGIHGINSVDTTVIENVYVPSKASVKLTLNNFDLSDSTNYWSVHGSYDTYCSYGRGIGWSDEKGKPINLFFNKKTTSQGFSKKILYGETAGNQFMKIRQGLKGKRFKYCPPILTKQLQSI